MGVLIGVLGEENEMRVEVRIMEGDGR